MQLALRGWAAATRPPQSRFFSTFPHRRYGPRTTMFVTLDDGVYEFTYGANGVEGWICSRERIEISKVRAKGSNPNPYP